VLTLTYKKLLGITVFLATTIFWVGVREHSVATIDAGIRAQESRTIVQTGKWFPIRFQGAPVADHPPLAIWSSAAAMKVFGVNDYGAQIAGRWFAILSVLMTLFVAWAAGLRPIQALAAVLILLSTRDFVLNGVRGYLEPFLQTFLYAGLAWVLVQRKRHLIYWPSLLAGICTFFALFSKGPPALIGALYFPFLLVFYSLERREAIFRVLYFLLGLGACLAILIGSMVLLDLSSFGWSYLRDQVYGSAIEGRGGLQGFEPFYFVKILFQHYWPWLPFLFFALLKLILKSWPSDQTWRSGGTLKHLASDPMIAVALFGLGIFLGFSLVRWKYWYYTVPAYPAFSLLIAAYLPQWFQQKLSEPRRVWQLMGGGLVWSWIVVLFPIELSHDRLPIAKQMQSYVTSQVPAGATIWVIRTRLDPNLLETVGGWYWDRKIMSVGSELAFIERDSKYRPLWIFTDSTTCVGAEAPVWCASTQERFSVGGASLREGVL